MHAEPPRGSGLTLPCWYSRVLYSNLLATSIIIETPVNAFLIESDHIFVSSDQNGDLVGLMSFKAEEWLFSALHAGDMLNTENYCLLGL